MYICVYMYVFIYLFIYAQAVYHEYAVNCRDSLQTNDPEDNILICSCYCY